MSINSLNSSSILHINTKFEAYRLIHDPTQLFSLLYSKYGDIEEDFYLKYINQLIYNIPTKLNCKFKELKYNDIFFDYLKRLYQKEESINRIPKLYNYYKNYYLFFCRPTFRNRILSKLISAYEDNKAQIFYKNNYQESKSKKLSDKSKSNKKNASFSFSSMDNITNNKIIFDKETRKMLDRNETEYNNYYNTLDLETSKSNNITNNNNCLISKRSLNDSFEKCIYALINYQNKKNIIKNNNKNSNKNKNEQKSEKKNYKRKNIIINNINSNFFKNKKLKKKLKMQSSNQNNSNINNNQKKFSIFIDKKMKNLGIKKITRVNSNLNNKNILLSSKNRKNSLFSLSNNNYLSNRINILSNSITNIKSNKKGKKKG